MTTVALAAGCGAVSEHFLTSWEADPERLIAQLTGGLSPNDRYRDPNVRERSTARRAARALITEDASVDDRDRLFEALGFAVYRGTDPATGRPFDLYLVTGSDDRSWGAVLLDRGVTAHTVVEVPHPSFDINTEKLGLALHRRIPGSVLLVAGAHRDAANGDADVAHNDRSLFHVLAIELGRNGLDQIQLHGFADHNLPAVDAVVSTGSAPVGKSARGIAHVLSDAGLRTCRAWAARCGPYEAKTNAQGRATARFDGVFLHVELSWSVRGDEATWARVIAAMARRLDHG